MADINFDCPHCGHNLDVNERGAGLTVACPECSKNIEIPMPAPEVLVSNIIFNCGSCGQPLKAAPDIAGQLIDCPVCSQSAEVPFASRPMPSTPTRTVARSTPIPKPPSQKQVTGTGTSNPSAPAVTRPSKATSPGLVVAVISLALVCAVLVAGMFYLIKNSSNGGSTTAQVTSVEPTSGQSATQSAPSISSETIAALDVKGVKLGMSADDVRALFPSLDVSDDGRGSLNDKSNGDLKFQFASPPYGKGVCFVHLTTELGDVDPSTFIAQFKTDLAAKYGKPTDELKDEHEGRSENDWIKIITYRAYWGATNAYRDDFRSMSLRWPSDDSNMEYYGKLNVNASSGNLVDGKYLYARFKTSYFNHAERASSPEPDIVLFDTSPYIKEAQAEKEKLIKASQKKVDF